MKSLVLSLALLALCGTAFGEALNNPYINAPQIAPITVNGNVSDWTDSSGWKTFGGWFQAGAKLASTTEAQFAWNDATNMFYMAIRTNQAGGIIEVGGFLGDLAATATPNVSPQYSVATNQIEFSNFGPGTIGSIASQGLVGQQLLSGVTAAVGVSGGKMYLEIATPIYSDWTNAASAMNLLGGQNVYMYADIFSPGWAGGDSLVSNGQSGITYQGVTYGQVYTYGSGTAEFGSQVTLVPEPITMVLLGLGGLFIRRK